MNCPYSGDIFNIVCIRHNLGKENLFGLALNLRFALKEAFLNFRRTKALNLVSIGMIASSLFLLGVFLLTTVNLQEMIRKFEERVKISVFLRDGLNKERREALKKKISLLVGVKEVIYISKEEALQIFSEDLRDWAELLGSLETNPLPASFQIILKEEFKSPEKMAQLVKQISSLEGVEDIEYGERWITPINRWIRIILLADFFLLVMACLSSILVVSHTIRLTIAARRETIGVMKLVGARDGFIRRPFLIEGLFQGLSGSTLAALLLYLCYRFILFEASQLFSLEGETEKKLLLFQNRGLSIQFLPNQWIIWFILGGAILGLVGSGWAIRGFLKGEKRGGI